MVANVRELANATWYLLGAGHWGANHVSGKLSGEPGTAKQLREAAHVSVAGDPTPIKDSAQDEVARGAREAGEPILLVDDDEDWCKECAFSLSRLGYEALIAHNPSDAMALFQENDVSVAIVDYNLPEGDGITLIHALSRQAQEQERPLNFIMATGYATKDLAIGAMRAAVTDILEKPISQIELRAALQRIKGLRPSAPAREKLLDKISDLSSELQRLAQLMDTPDPGPTPTRIAPVGTDGEVDQVRLNAFIRDLLRREAKRRQIGGGELFGDPTWAMLLDLLLAKFEDRRISVSSACIASGAPMSTALRLVRRLVGEEVLVRLPDEHDRRRHFLVINPRLEQPLLDHIAEQLRQDESRQNGNG
jgi:CheY-like chemotaxis protein